MPTDQTFVIVGASLAGAKAAATLHEEGFDGRLMRVGAEVERRLDVTVVDPAAVPLERVRGTEVGAIYRDIHNDHAVALQDLAAVNRGTA
jgi:NADPH-dependent 2,4-dienoyl-CoA reductase/sulfur reductase-like enzyme